MGPLNVHDLDELYRPLDPSAFRYNPRCLERSFNVRPLHRFAGAAAVQRILAAQTIQEFLAVLDPSTAGPVGRACRGPCCAGPDDGRCVFVGAGSSVLPAPCDGGSAVGDVAGGRSGATGCAEWDGVDV
ncbi:hypothetical protein V6000_007647 [Aspergillus fumigatus]|uniref:Polyphenol monooxygenase, putative n=1 Tax=Aspergillus fumigatus (strain CBS 144.89 / FGSC A1163 / CEA10) TaxID=451804 RepID=B0Y4Y3_ASPFC|nr:polyphenol monooxygenase, putative [Aspergillus fumigatus A1163]